MSRSKRRFLVICSLALFAAASLAFYGLAKLNETPTTSSDTFSDLGPPLLPGNERYFSGRAELTMLGNDKIDNVRNRIDEWAQSIDFELFDDSTYVGRWRDSPEIHLTVSQSHINHDFGRQTTIRVGYRWILSASSERDKFRNQFNRFDKFVNDSIDEIATEFSN